MIETEAFTAFLTFYHAVLSSPVLTVAEKTEALEAAGDEWVRRNHPPGFDRPVKRLLEDPARAARASSKQPTKTKAHA